LPLFNRVGGVLAKRVELAVRCLLIA
jgi:hypothetical protein